MSHYPDGLAFACFSYSFVTGVLTVDASGTRGCTLTDDSTGRFTVNFNTARPSSNYVVAASWRRDAAELPLLCDVYLRRGTSNARSTSTCALQTVDGDGSPTLIDGNEVAGAFYGQAG